MVKQNAIKVFEEKKVRTVWDSDKEEWYFSIVDVVAVLTDSPNPRNYWKVLKHRLVKEGNESVTNCNQLPGFFVDLPLENRYLKLFVMPDTLTGYLALILGGFPSIGLYSGVSDFFLVRGCGDRYYWLRSYCILV